MAPPVDDGRRRRDPRDGRESYVDPERWPGVARLPEASFLGRRAVNLQQRLEDLTQEHGVALTPGATPRFVVDDGLVLDRVVDSGWLGLAEGYMAGEWTAEPLPDVLGVLLTQPLEGGFGRTLSRRRRRVSGHVRAGDLPDSLVDIYAGRYRATGSALFASGTRTSEVENPDQDGHHPAVTVRYFDAPTDPELVDRADLDSAQRHRINAMLDEAQVGPGHRVLELPSSGGALPVMAAQRGAHVDVLTSDVEHAERVRAYAHDAGVGGAVRVQTIRGPVPSPRQWSGTYDAIFSVERMETLGDDGTIHFLRAVERMLASDGIAVIQSVVRVPDSGLPDETVGESLDVMRAYVWPAVECPTDEHVLSRANRAGLRLTARNRMGSHYATTLALWRSAFNSRERAAAAAGFDAVYRRLWNYQFALHEALARAGALDCEQFVFRRF
ncbi:class I SAM-dependent methyltransferase [Corynebacterium glyciniphilum]|uniref:class I SAM-dependent methyltransferase n=1 Tax=Corynebacterium glyciniphilum TaxID=1404244 RepID=UPI002650321F|nr:class I SAM-dependent methyltransferase [Corynebacterium glyciniphilum]MDN5684088.1 class I SAM-dependent methyltransferase [Corynebacterium glyciniphilum]